jgi:dipeptidyl aminopeptidase/acylaminoacyl peptidase
LVALDWDIDNLALSPDGRYLAYAVNAGGDYSLHLYDLESRMTRSAPELGDSAGVAASFFEKIIFSPDGRRLAFTFSCSTRTGDVHIWDLQEDLVQAVTHSSHGGLPRSAFVDPQLIHYPTFDTDETGEPRQIPAWFYKPVVEEGERLPVVLIMHGGPESQAQPYFSFLVQFLINNGYAVLAPNVRGSNGYGKAYSHLDDVEKRMDSVADMAYAAYWLKAQPDVDGDKLVAYGGSYGGFMVLGALTAYPDLWAAGVNIVGISNFVTFLENTSGYRRRHREAEYGSLERDREFLEQISPLNHIDKIVAPLMIIHGENDPRVPASEARQLAAGLEEKDVPVEVLIFDDEGHGLAKLKNKLIAYPAIVDFLQKYV